METTLHRQLKELYCDDNSDIEVKIGRYRIDVVRGKRLIEIQHSSLAAIRDKINTLLQEFKVDVVKPIILRKRLVKLSKKNGEVISSRNSPKKGGFLDLIDELLYFTRTFPHPNLRIVTPMITIDEFRYPGHGKRRRRRQSDFVVQDRMLTDLIETKIYRHPADLLASIPKLPKEFCTKKLAEAMKIHRWQSQRIAYVLKHIGAFKVTGKQGNSIQYQFSKRHRSKSPTKKRSA